MAAEATRASHSAHVRAAVVAERGAAAQQLGEANASRLLDLEWRETELDVHADILVSLQNPTVVGWRETLLCLVRPTHLV